MNQKIPESNKPNILLIMCDTVRCDALGCMGGPAGITDNLDYLARQGVMFTRSYSVSPVCSPARCSLLTGVYPHIHRAVENGISRDTSLPVFPDLLKEQGYYNIMVGKTHFGPVPDSFDVQKVLNGEKGFESDDFYGEFARSHGYKRASTPPFDKPEEYCADAFLAKTTIEEIEKARDKNQPFFAFCSMLSPHGVIDTPPRFRGKIKAEDLKPVSCADGEQFTHPPRLSRLLGLDDHKASYGDEFDEAQGKLYSKEYKTAIDEFRADYYSLMSYCDDYIGKIIDYLNENNLRENTLVIFTSDHGQQYFDHGFNDKHNFYDESFRVPLIMSMPGTLPQGLKESFASTVDVTASILAAAGVSPHPEMSGFDLFTFLKEGTKNPRCCATGVLFGYTALVSENYKLEYYLCDGIGRLFDLKNDPAEQINLFDNKDYKEIKQELLRALLTWYGGTMDIYYLKENSHGGGPVAERAQKIIDEITAHDSEKLLQQIMGEIDI